MILYQVLYDIIVMFSYDIISGLVLKQYCIMSIYYYWSVKCLRSIYQLVIYDKHIHVLFITAMQQDIIFYIVYIRVRYVIQYC